MELDLVLPWEKDRQRSRRASMTLTNFARLSLGEFPKQQKAKMVGNGGHCLKWWALPTLQQLDWLN